jgi:hypothetical protein
MDENDLTRDDRRFIARFRRSWNKQATVTSVTFSLQEKLASLPSSKPWTIESRNDMINCCQLLSRINHRLLDRDGNNLVQYIPQFIKPNHHDDLISAINNLRAIIPPFPPSSKWKRFDLSSKSTSTSENPGYYFYGVHHELGHQMEPPVLSIHWAAKTCRGTAAGEAFRSSTAFTKLSTELSLIFHALDKDYWLTYREAYKNIAESIIKLQTVDRCKIQAFMGVYVLVDLRTEPPVDMMDPPEGWAAMVVLGKFEGGPLYLPDLKTAVPHQSCDVTFLRARLLQHFIGDYSGERYVLVFTTSTTIFKWLKMRFGSSDQDNMEEYAL